MDKVEIYDSDSLEAEGRKKAYLQKVFNEWDIDYHATITTKTNRLKPESEYWTQGLDTPKNLILMNDR